jgi:hypothetical protein
MIDSTIFDGVVTNENSFTELFKNFLRYKVFRDSFLSLIEFGFDKDYVEYEDFDTQLTITKFGRPDLALITEETEILFEIKVYDTVLTYNQPSGYYNYLKSKSIRENKALILIVPNDYYDLIKYDVILKSIQGESDNIYTQVIYWDTIANLITSLELETMSLLFQEYSCFLTSWFHMNSINLDTLNVTTMFGKEFPESLEKTLEIIDNVFKEFKKRGYVIKFTSSKHFDEYGFNFISPNDDVFYFGMWFDYWKNSGNPICICFYSDDVNRNHLFNSTINSNNLTPSTEFDEYQVTFIDKSTLMDVKSEIKISKVLSEFAVNLNFEMAAKEGELKTK